MEITHSYSLYTTFPVCANDLEMIEFMTALVSIAPINSTWVTYYSEIHKIRQVQTDHKVTTILNNGICNN